MAQGSHSAPVDLLSPASPFLSSLQGSGSFLLSAHSPLSTGGLQGAEAWWVVASVSCLRWLPLGPWLETLTGEVTKLLELSLAEPAEKAAQEGAEKHARSRASTGGSCKEGDPAPPPELVAWQSPGPCRQTCLTPGPRVQECALRRSWHTQRLPRIPLVPHERVSPSREQSHFLPLWVPHAPLWLQRIIAYNAWNVESKSDIFCFLPDSRSPFHG